MMHIRKSNSQLQMMAPQLKRKRAAEIAAKAGALRAAQVTFPGHHTLTKPLNSSLFDHAYGRLLKRLQMPVARK